MDCIASERVSDPRKRRFESQEDKAKQSEREGKRRRRRRRRNNRQTIERRTPVGKRHTLLFSQSLTLKRVKKRIKCHFSLFFRDGFKIREREKIYTGVKDFPINESVLVPLCVCVKCRFYDIPNSRGDAEIGFISLWHFANEGTICKEQIRHRHLAVVFFFIFLPFLLGKINFRKPAACT